MKDYQHHERTQAMTAKFDRNTMSLFAMTYAFLYRRNHGVDPTDAECRWLDSDTITRAAARNWAHRP